MGGPHDLPTVVLEEGAMYWVKPRYGEHPKRWTVARWEHGCFWGVSNNEVSPSIICGPIPPPAESGASPSTEGSELLPPAEPLEALRKSEGGEG